MGEKTFIDIERQVHKRIDDFVNSVQYDNDRQFQEDKSETVRMTVVIGTAETLVMINGPLLELIQYLMGMTRGMISETAELEQLLIAA